MQMVVTQLQALCTVSIVGLSKSFPFARQTVEIRKFLISDKGGSSAPYENIESVGSAGDCRRAEMESWRYGSIEL